MLTLVMSQRLSMAVFYSLQQIVREQTISYLQMVLQSKDIIIASVWAHYSFYHKGHRTQIIIQNYS